MGRRDFLISDRGFGISDFFWVIQIRNPKSEILCASKGIQIGVYNL